MNNVRLIKNHQIINLIQPMLIEYYYLISCVTILLIFFMSICTSSCEAPLLLDNGTPEVSVLQKSDTKPLLVMVGLPCMIGVCLMFPLATPIVLVTVSSSVQTVPAIQVVREFESFLKDILTYNGIDNHYIGYANYFLHHIYEGVPYSFTELTNIQTNVLNLLSDSTKLMDTGIQYEYLNLVWNIWSHSKNISEGQLVLLKSASKVNFELINDPNNLLLKKQLLELILIIINQNL